MLRINNKKICAALLALAAALCAGCSGTPEQEQTTAVSSSAQLVFTTPSAAAIANEDELPRPQEKKPLRIALEGGSDKFSPFYPEGEAEKIINSLTGVKLIARDRAGMPVLKGISGEQREYNGKTYTYKGIADIGEKYDEENEQTVYSVKLRSGVKFSDGEPLTADDVIFTLYFLLDPSFENSPLRDAGIVGEVNYRLDCALAESFSDEDIGEALDTDEVKKILRETLTEPLLKSELEWVKTLYGSSEYAVYTAVYREPKDLLAFFYSTNGAYDPSAADEAQVLSDLADMYGGDYELLGSVYRGDTGFFKTQAQACAIAYLAEQSGENAPVDSISGIVKTGRLSLDIAVKEGCSKLPLLLTEVTAAPLHYYGEKSEYDYEKGLFGLKKGEAAAIAAEKTDVPLGAGAFTLEKSENGVIYLTANENYYKGAPQTEKLEIIQGSGAGVSAVSDGSADIIYTAASAATAGEIENANSSLEKAAAFGIAQDGYGFIGINANTVNIDGDPLSQESCMLRKALATAISVFRGSSVSEYYGSFGAAVNAPAPAAPYLKGTELEGFEPYSTDTDGEPIYMESMDEKARRSAAKKACLAYLEEAGYTIEERKVTAPPDGGETSFRAVIAAGGSGDHPSYAALSNAAKLLDEIGIKLYITDTADATQLWSEISGGTQQIWAYVWETGVKADLSEMYPAENLFGVDGDELSDMIETINTSGDAEEISAAYEEFYSRVFDEYAVEIPVYQRTGCVVFSTLRVDVKTVPADMTCYYGWADEAEKIIRKS